MKRLSAVLLGVLLAVAGGAFAVTTGGFPSRPRVQQLTAIDTTSGTSASVQIDSVTPGLRFRETDASANNGYWRCYVNAEVFHCGVQTDAGADVDFLTISRVAGTPAQVVAVQTSGNFTTSYDDACTTTPTVTYGYVRVGSLVTITPKASSGFPCTADTTVFGANVASIPAAIRPSIASVTVRSPVLSGCIDNNLNVGCVILVNSNGTLQLNRVTSTFAETTWTASASRLANSLGQSFSYYLGDP